MYMNIRKIVVVLMIAWTLHDLRVHIDSICIYTMYSNMYMYMFVCSALVSIREICGFVYMWCV